MEYWALTGRGMAQKMKTLEAGSYPKHSMYCIYTYIGVVWGVNVGIHGVSGYGFQ